MEINNLKHTTILVTGGTGFVGSHLVEELVKHSVRVIATYQTQQPQSYFFSQNLDKKTTMIQADVNNFEIMFDIVTKFQVDYIFHLAAQPLVEVAFHNPKRTLLSNIVGTIHILECARLFPQIQGVIVASSDKAYGKTGKKKYTEKTPLVGDHPYEVSKSSADLIAQSYSKTYDIPVVITRFGNIYGQGDLNFSRILPGIMKSIITDTTLDIRSDGTFVRDYLYVKDVVRGYLMLANNIKKTRGNAFNFGSNETRNVIEVIKTIEKALDTNIQYSIQNTAKNEIPYQSLDYTRIRKLVGWKPKHTLTSTAKDIYIWYKENIHG